jgi:hypothetical protein
LDDDEVAAPGRAAAARADPEERVAGAQPRTLARGAGQDGELVAQENVLGDEVRPPAQSRSDPGEQQRE